MVAALLFRAGNLPNFTISEAFSRWPRFGLGEKEKGQNIAKIEGFILSGSIFDPCFLGGAGEGGIAAAARVLFLPPLSLSGYN